jgi:hypothetical protein
MNPYIDSVLFPMIFTIIISFLLGIVLGMMIHHYFIAPKEKTSWGDVLSLKHGNLGGKSNDRIP